MDLGELNMTVKDVLEKFDTKNNDVNEIDLCDIHELTTYQYTRSDIKFGINNFGKCEVSNIQIDNDEGLITLSISFV